MKIFIGLGNFEDKYIGTRHNVGRDFLIWMTSQANFSDFVSNKYQKVQTSKGEIDGEEVEIVLPEAFMNVAGESVAKYLESKDQTNDSIYIFHDDIDMNFGDVKLTTGNSGTGGHNGVQSIFDHIKRRDFNRVKFGIISKRLFGGFKKPNKDEVASFVLKKFSKGEQSKLEEIYKKAFELIK